MPTRLAHRMGAPGYALLNSVKATAPRLLNGEPLNQKEPGA